MAFWVVGGEYADTRFQVPAAGKSLERHGPFETYKQAYDVWSSRARATVDDALIRFRVVEGTEAIPGTGPDLAAGEIPSA